MRKTKVTIVDLHNRIITVCPIGGIAYAKGSYRIDFKEDATSDQRDAAQEIVAAFDPDETVDAEPTLEDVVIEMKQLRQKLKDTEAVKPDAFRAQN